MAKAIHGAADQLGKQMPQAAELVHAAASRLDSARSPLPEKQAVAKRLDHAPLPPSEEKTAERRAPARADHPFKGIALILLSTIFLGTSDVTSKYLSATLPSVEIAWIRFMVFAIIMVPAMVPGTAIYSLRTNSVPLQLLRAGVKLQGVMPAKARARWFTAALAGP